MVPTHVSCVVHVLCNLVVQKSSSMNEWPRGVYIELKNNLMIFFLIIRFPRSRIREKIFAQQGYTAHAQHKTYE
jgi:hypothetical protein